MSNAVSASGMEGVGLQDMLEMLQELGEKFAAYDQRMEEIAGIQKDTETKAENDCSETVKALQEQTEEEQKNARQRSQAWHNKAKACMEEADRVHGQIVKQLTRAAQYGSSIKQELTERDSVDLLVQESRVAQTHNQPDDNEQLLKLHTSGNKLYKSLMQSAEAMKKAADTQCDAELTRILGEYSDRRERAMAARDTEVEESRSKAQARIERARQNLIETVQEDLVPAEQAAKYARLQKNLVDYDTFQPAKVFPEGFNLGYAVYDTAAQEADPVKRRILNGQFAFARGADGTAQELAVPYGYRFTDPKVSVLFAYDSATRQQVVAQLRSLVMQLYMSIPCGKARFTFLDPVDGGNSFAIFSRLGEIDERIIDTHIWSDEERIEERLKAIEEHTEDVIQRCLQGRFKDIIEYNASAGKNAEPLRFLVVMDFPRRFTKRSMDILESIISKGPQNGVYTILAADISDLNGPNCPPELSKVFQSMNRVTVKDGVLCTDVEVGGAPLRYRPLPAPTHEQAQAVIDTLRVGIQESEKIEITYDDVSDNLLEKPEYWFHYDAANGIDVPIGMEGANKSVMLQLGGVNRGGKKRPFHAMVAGNIGSGKTNTLHTIILSTLLHYNPEDVQMYLLDFKHGVEFKTYANAGLANFRVIAIDTEPEFGLAVLRDLEKEVERRSARLREVGEDRIESYRSRMAREGVVHHGMPRLLVIFDEYQEIFREADNPVMCECAQLLSQVVLLAGSALGIHIILATQDINNVHALDTSLYRQFETRIALKCDESVCQTILSPDNEAARVLITADTGQGVFNDAGGHRDYNRLFRVALIDKQERLDLLQQIHDRQQQLPDLQGPKTRLLLSSVQDDKDNVLNRFRESGAVEETPDQACHLYIAQSLSMVNNFRMALWNRSGQNLLLIGSNQSKARKICTMTAFSLLYETIRLKHCIDRPVITVFDFGGAMAENEDDPFTKLYRSELPEAFRVFDTIDVVRGLQILQEELEQEDRTQDDRHFVIFFGLNRARRLLPTAYYENSPREILVNLLRNGPENGMNFIVWANDPSLYLDNYGDTLDLFEYRFGFDMSPAEYKATLNYVVRESKEGGNRKEGDLNAISFNISDDNQKIRFYDMPTDDWVKGFVGNCEAYIQ